MESQTIQSKIYEIRGFRVMLDFDLAALYGVLTKVLKQAVKRNIERFPEDFMFELSPEEFKNLGCRIGTPCLRSQTVTSNRGGTRYMPFAFTEQGVSMLSAVLRSSVAVQVSITIMRAFVIMRSYLTSNATVTAELAEIRAKLELLERSNEETMEAVNDLSEDIRKDIDNLYHVIGELSVINTRVEKPRKRIGFDYDQ
ncbi:MAG: ORF6N domain-containing protein [Culturomica sp.]|jgi:hypothetical protein|nr:ORF6N domain-containing protein [Culturomica sp.]